MDGEDEAQGQSLTLTLTLTVNLRVGRRRSSRPGVAMRCAWDARAMRRRWACDNSAHTHSAHSHSEQKHSAHKRAHA